MTYYKANSLFLTVANLNVKCCLAYYPPEDPNDRGQTYQVEIQTPLPAGTANLISTIIRNNDVKQIRTPVRDTHAGPRGKLVLI